MCYLLKENSFHSALAMTGNCHLIQRWQPWVLVVASWQLTVTKLGEGDYSSLTLMHPLLSGLSGAPIYKAESPKTEAHRRHGSISSVLPIF